VELSLGQWHVHTKFDENLFIASTQARRLVGPIAGLDMMAKSKSYPYQEQNLSHLLYSQSLY
jgi:hypothetical protein